MDKYLTLTYPVFRSSNKRKPYTKGPWSLILGFPGVNNFGIILSKQQKIKVLAKTLSLLNHLVMASNVKGDP